MTDTIAPVRQVGAAEAVRLAADGYRVIDVREPHEWQRGHIPGATLLPLTDVPARAAEVLPDRDAPLLLHCAHGARSARASAYLASLGYRQVANLTSSLDEWRAAGGAWEVPSQGLGAEQLERYGRQLLLPEIGEEGQRRLLAGRVLVIGAGGLGSPAALYLAAAGVGTIGLVDDDVVELSNLQRQLLHTTERIGQPKTASARAALGALNPGTRLVEHAERLDEASAERLIAGYDVVIDGSDSFATRYALNDAAVRQRKPVVHASVYRWEGQVTTLVPFDGPCYRCIYPQPLPEELAPDCATAGVLGALTGLAGTLQALEASKLLLGVGEPLVGRLLTFDLRSVEFRDVAVPRDPTCPTCGSSAAH
jgi:molybdopterin/thiamine biosynthesis adenylyltransferase/rhodanese-related sulfurtransferase